MEQHAQSLRKRAKTSAGVMRLFLRIQEFAVEFFPDFQEALLHRHRGCGFGIAQAGLRPGFAPGSGQRGLCRRLARPELSDESQREQNDRTKASGRADPEMQAKQKTK